MELHTERKCSYCGHTIEVTQESLPYTLKFGERFFHESCFKEAALSPTYLSIGPADIEDLREWKKAARDDIMPKFYRDNLEVYILSRYDVSTLSDEFWAMVDGIGQGRLKGKRCVSVDERTLLSLWRWAQPLCDSSARTRERNGQFIYGENRVRYDLVLVMSQWSHFKSWRGEQQAVANEVRNIPVKPTIDLDRVKRNEKRNKNLRAIFEKVYGDGDSE